MVPVTIRGLLDLLDKNNNEQVVLDAARSMQSSLSGGLSSGSHTAHLYAGIMVSLCKIRLNGPDQNVAAALHKASDNALLEGNRGLSTLALWYGACCRMMYLFPAGHNGHAFDVHGGSRMSAELHQLISPAHRQYSPELAAVAATMVLEYALRVRLQPQTLADLTEQAHLFMKNANDANPRVRARAEFMTEVTRLGDAPPVVSHASLLYLPGELAATIR